MSVKLAATGSIVDGKTITDWTQDWWNWIVDGPKSPFNQSDDKTGLLGYINNHGPVFFLAGNNPFSTSGNNTNRYIVVSHDKEILVPLLNFIDIEGPGITDSITRPPRSASEYRDLVDQSLAANVPSKSEVTGLSLSVDGKAFDFGVLKSHLEATDFFSMGPVKLDSLLTGLGADIKSGFATDFNKATGYWAMLENLSVGLHTISFGGSFTKNNVETSVHTTDHLFVV